ncbi:MAG TPA: hypothetical protein VGC28_01860 [Sphingomonas sp.]
MTARTDSFTLIGRRMRKGLPVPPVGEMPSIAEVLRRIDRAIAERKAA